MNKNSIATKTKALGWQIDWNKFVKEVGEWSARNFPKNKPHHPLLGIIEESGEFEEAREIEAQADALADRIVYLADFCYRNDLKLTPNYTPVPANRSSLSHYLQILGRLCHFHLKGEHGIRYDKAEVRDLKELFAGSVLDRTALRAHEAGLNLHDIVLSTWAEVKKRDWTKYKKDGRKK